MATATYRRASFSRPREKTSFVQASQPESAEWSWPSLKDRSPDWPLWGESLKLCLCWEVARGFVASRASWTRHSLCAPNSELSLRPTLSSAAVKTFPILAFRSTRPGVQQSCRPAVEWGLARDESADR